MSLSDDLVLFFNRLQTDTANSTFHRESILEILTCQPEFHELKERVGKLSTPEQQMLLSLRALAAQQAALAPRLVEASLVVTFPDDLQISARHTAQVVRDMIAGARDEILIAGFAMNTGGGLGDLLAKAAARVARIVLLCSDWKGTDGSDARKIFRDHWPKHGPRPELFEYKTVGGTSAMHIKCMIVDGSQILIGSANFTYSGMKKNFEMGVWIKGEIARSARIIFDEFLRTGKFTKIE